MTDQKRVFKTKIFDRWAMKLLSDDMLCRAAREIEQGLFEADLGGGICKKRVAILIKHVRFGILPSGIDVALD